MTLATDKFDVFRVRSRGLSLIELMVALTIGAVLIFGATQVYVDSRNAYAANESIARLQETARYALSVIEPDVRLSNYWGLNKDASLIPEQATQTAATAAVANGANANICGNNFAVDLNTNIQGDDNGYVLSASRQAGCNTLSGWTTTPVATADTLTVRRASNIVSMGFTNGVLQICSSRVPTGNALYSNAGVCAAAPDGQINNLIVHAYYVDRNSEQQAGLPSLRRKSLTSVGGQPAFIDEEVIAGVEDVQVQFGIEAPPASGATGVVQRYVDPVAIPVGTQVVAVRIWLLVRAESPDPGFVDDRVYQYGQRATVNGANTSDLNNTALANRAYQPSLSADNSFTGIKRYRRLLISRTIQIRNAMGT